MNEQKENVRPVLSIQIGQSEAVIYHVAQTRAPRAYDGFGTIQLADYGDEGRLVMIRHEHLVWQTGRYSSGMFASAGPEYYDREAVIEELWKRITQADI